jgi:hypothetical protein
MFKWAQLRYLTLAAEYTGSPLRDDFIGSIVPEEAGLSWDLGDWIRDWNERYREITPLDMKERASGRAAELIVALDDEGRSLVAAISASLEGDAKVRYYSEGLLRFS